jgi:hypothetical protein
MSSPTTRRHKPRASLRKRLRVMRSLTNLVCVRSGRKARPKRLTRTSKAVIENNFEASLKAHKNFDQQHISYDAKNGTLVLKSSVKTPAQRPDARQSRAERQGSCKRNPCALSRALSEQFLGCLRVQPGSNPVLARPPPDGVSHSRREMAHQRCASLPPWQPDEAELCCPAHPCRDFGRSPTAPI